MYKDFQVPTAADFLVTFSPMPLFPLHSSDKKLNTA